MEVPLGHCYDKKSMVPRKDSMVALNHNKKSSVDDLSADEVPLDLCSARSDFMFPLDHNKKSSVDNLSADEVTVVDRWHDSDDWNDHKHRLIRIPTTSHPGASVFSGRDTLDPTQIEMSAVAILEFCRSTTSDKAHNSNDHYGSIGELRPGAEDGSCKGGSSTTRI